jgi:CheY-like chemotaxis protein
MAEVLIIARDWTPRVLTRAQLEEEGHEVTGRLTLEEGLLELRTHPRSYDVVIFDTKEQELAPRLLLRLARAGPPVVVLAGQLDRSQLEKSGAVFDRVLTRPVFVGDLVSATRDALHGAPAPRPASSH